MSTFQRRRFAAGLGTVAAAWLAACSTSSGPPGNGAEFDAGNVDATFAVDEGTDAPAEAAPPVDATADAGPEAATSTHDSEAPEAAVGEAGATDSAVTEASVEDAAPEAGLDGSAVDSSLPAVDAGALDSGIAGFGGAVSVSSGDSDGCAITKSGAVVCWGVNEYGQLGNGSSMTTPGYSDVPVQVTGITGGATSVAVGQSFTCAAVSGAAMCWGINDEDMLGIPSTTMTSGVPVQVMGLTSGVTAVSAGQQAACALASGSVWCWGSNNAYQMGTSSVTIGATIDTPVQVSGLTGAVTSLSVGYSSACAVAGGSVMCWGFNNEGQLGNGSMMNGVTPVQVTGLTTGATSVSVGFETACAAVGGNVWCWGWNGHGQLGVPSTTMASSTAPVQIAGLTGVTTVSFGAVGNTVCALTSAGGVQCWGQGDSGQLGNGGAADSPTPVQVTGLTSGATGISAGYEATCAVVSCGVQCWGIGAGGALGNGATGQSLTPSPVKLLGSAVCP
jgi:alpha-tubulin suppressor-like RCC1 family protein